MESPRRTASARASKVFVTKSDLVVRRESIDHIDRRFVVLRQIGAGSFGRVNLLRDRRTGVERVCKSIKIKGMREEVLAQMKKEIITLQELDHPRIVRLFEYAEDLQRAALYLIMEYMPGGSCDELLRDGRRPCEDLVARLLQQVLSATAYCHARGIVHCDMKLENIILTRQVTEREASGDRPFWRCCCCRHHCAEPVDCKVIDFGLAAHFVPSGPDSIVQFAGTPAFVAPEVIRVMSGGRAFGPKADIWSIGVVAYNLLTGKLPFGHHGKDYGGDFQQVFENIKAFRGVDFNAAEWQDCTEEACSFVEELLQWDVETRPSAPDALQHEWVQDRIPLYYKRLRRSMLRSFKGYSRAPQLVKICLLLIASRTAGRQFKSCEQAFMRLDVGGAGMITVEDLQSAIDNPGGFCPWLCYPRVSAAEVFREVNLSRTQGIEYTQFCAACLYAKLGGKTGRELARLAFDAFDDDGDGLVTTQAMLAFFATKHREELPLLSTLPVDRPFRENEFYQCLRDGQPAGCGPCTFWSFCRGPTSSAEFNDDASDDCSSQTSSVTTSCHQLDLE